MSTLSALAASPLPDDLDACEDNADSALVGIGCPSCRRANVSRTARSLQLCSPPRVPDISVPSFERAAVLLLRPAAVNALDLWSSTHAAADQLTVRRWVNIDHRLAKYLAEQARNVPRVLLRVGFGGDPSTWVPQWAGVLLGVGGKMKDAKLSTGAWPRSRNPGALLVRTRARGQRAVAAPPPDETLVNWPHVLRLCAAVPALRRQLFSLMVLGATPQQLHEWLTIHLPACFGREPIGGATDRRVD